MRSRVARRSTTVEVRRTRDRTFFGIGSPKGLDAQNARHSQPTHRPAYEPGHPQASDHIHKRCEYGHLPERSHSLPPQKIPRDVLDLHTRDDPLSYEFCVIRGCLFGDSHMTHWPAYTARHRSRVPPKRRPAVGDREPYTCPPPHRSGEFIDEQRTYRQTCDLCGADTTDATEGAAAEGFLRKFRGERLH